MSPAPATEVTTSTAYRHRWGRNTPRFHGGPWRPAGRSGSGRDLLDPAPELFDVRQVLGAPAGQPLQIADLQPFVRPVGDVAVRSWGTQFLGQGRVADQSCEVPALDVTEPSGPRRPGAVIAAKVVRRPVGPGAVRGDGPDFGPRGEAAARGHRDRRERGRP